MANHRAADDPMNDPYKRELADVFSRSARTYGQVGPRVFSYFGRRLVELSQVQKGAKILDVAAGRGAVLFPAAEITGLRGIVTGIDISAGMVQETAAQISASGIHNAQMKLMDAENLDFPDAHFDFVLCGFAIFFFPQPERALAEFLRVLKAGGTLGVTTFQGLFGGEWSWFGKLIQAYSPPQIEPEPDPESEPQAPEFETAEGMQRLFSTAGYTEIQVLFEDVEFTYRDEEEWWATLWSVRMREFFEGLEKRLGTEGLERFKQESFSKLARLKQADGIHHHYPVLYTLAKKTSR